MTDRMNIIPQPLVPPGTTARSRSQAPARSGAASFDQLLNEQLQPAGLRFSRHAQERMASRGIALDSAQLGRVEQAVSQVQSKGGRDSLVMVDGTALVVSVKNQTVVTVVGQDHLKDNVFTNIDSAIIA